MEIFSSREEGGGTEEFTPILNCYRKTSRRHVGHQREDEKSQEIMSDTLGRPDSGTPEPRNR